jgi:aminopeptidase
MGDVVRIRMSPVAEPLTLAVYKEVLRAGGLPFVRMVPEECQQLLAQYGSPAQLGHLSSYDLQEMKTINADIAGLAHRNTRAMTNADPRKQAIMNRARHPLLTTALARSGKTGSAKLRWVGTQYPCHASAQEAEMSLTEYEDFVFKGGMLHLRDPVAAWKKLHTAQQRLVGFLNKASEVRCVVPGGTDIRFGVKGRRWINCDGENNFPDGEVFTGPVESETDGEIRFNFPAVYQGHEVDGIRLRFRAGKVVDAEASKGEDFLVQMIGQDKGARTLGELALGTNYAIEKFTRNTLFDEKIGGTLHVALGAAYPLSGGKNKSALHWDMVCDLRRGGRVEVDGKVISKNGRFVRPTWPQPMAGRK